MLLMQDVKAMADRVFIVNDAMHTSMSPQQIADEIPDDVVNVLVERWHYHHKPKD